MQARAMWAKEVIDMQGDRATPSAGMLCPVCNVELVMTERQNIEIDYCPRCRGVWLDRGELDKIIERSAAEERRSTPPGGHDVRYEPDRAQTHSFGHKPHRKKSWMDELFD